MNISDLPVATNYAQNTSGKLRPFVPGRAKTDSSSGSSSSSSSGNHDEIKIQSIYACDNAYTKQDAIMQELMKPFTQAISDKINGRPPAARPKTGGIAGVEKKLQAAGPSKEVDWSNLSSDFKGTDFYVFGRIS